MHDTLEELIEIAQDRQQWRQLVETLASKNRHNTQKANTVAKTTALIEALHFYAQFAEQRRYSSFYLAPSDSARATQVG